MKKSARKALNRSGQNECQVCEEGHILVEHHIRGRDIPSANNPSNLCNICSNCHRLIHEGKIIVEGHFQTTAGKELLWHSVDEASFTGEKAETYLIP